MTLIPAPTRMTLGDGRFRPPASSLSVRGPEWVRQTLSVLTSKAHFPQARFVEDAGADITVLAPDNAPLVPSELPDSSYRLEISADGITISCAEPAGLTAALRTLRGLENERTFPCGSIDDRPRFAYRGVHLDVCRHFFSADFVRRFIELIATLGMNVFHWHLTEDQGWRLPVASLPRLTEVGAWRTDPDGTRAGGSYTEEQIRDVVRYAGHLGVLVIPEVELPGHAQAAIASYPNLSCEQQQVEVWNRWGISETVFCAGNDEVFSFLETVFDTVVDLFPSRYVHLGGDECPKVTWRACPRCQERMRREGLADEDELQSYFVGRVARALEARGRTAIGWDEILEGGLPAGTTVMSWRGTEGGIKAAGLGHDVIMTPTSHCYFDYRQEDRADVPGFRYKSEEGRYRVLPITRVYEFDPLVGIPVQAHARVLGGQANVWTEELDSEALVEQMVMPRLLAMSEALWAAPTDREFARFAARARAWIRERNDGWTVARVPELKA